ncbi:MAG: metal-dependent hydrolase [Desulfamplus sp.]|nr:metal-dependent hydrolase [Desulfamplus sp.]MBF0413789.1 metal-dependent hydrolase [Desulfamplus sp.]
MSGFKTHLYGGMLAGSATSACFMLKSPSIFTPTQLGGIFFTGTIGGLLPDLDSDTSRPFSMLLTFLSMIIPVLFFKEISMIWLYLIPYIDKLSAYLSKWLSFSTKASPFPTIEQITPEFTITYFIISYILIRYVICELVKRLTIHRGIMHSIPFAILCAEAGFLIFFPSGINMATAVGISIFAGFLTHLLLDEANSITLKHRFIPKLKKSTGTAFKLKSNSNINTLIIYILVIIGGVRIVELMNLLN